MIPEGRPARGPRLVLVLSENWTITPARDLRALVELAAVAEESGFDTVMVSEHVVLGPSAGAEGLMANPRAYAMPGNQDPATPWPSSIVLLAAIAAATTRIRLGAIALLAPLRHPLLIAKELATLDLLAEGRLVVQPTVSWHRDEYEALGVPFEQRGRLLDEHLAAWELLWRDSPASFAGAHYAFDEVWLEPKPWRPDGPRLWFGGASLHPRLLRRLVEHGHGFHPLGAVRREDVEALRAALAEAGRAPEEVEIVGGMRSPFPDDHSVAPLGPAIDSIVPQWEAGTRTFCIKPNQYVDDVGDFPAWCAEVVERVGALGLRESSG
ncbi:MAG: TIGR03619 family F420-dependent LLM class oxidoreductase [Gaiella sp.]